MKGLEFEQRVRERIREFDIPSLLALLEQHGYGEGDIEYRGHRTLVRQGHLVQDIQFIHVPRRRVLLTVNLGLLGVQSPLPAFFLQEMEQMDPPGAERMERFLGYFDHQLLRARFAGLYPERDATLMPGWEEAAPSRLSLLNLASPSTLHWLFGLTFPEGEVLVRREVRTQSVTTKGTQLSATKLGDATALSGFATVPTGGMEVLLHFQEERCATGRPWSLEAPHRLFQRLQPLLTRTALPLTVWMVVSAQGHAARLQPDTYLGYAPLQRGSLAPPRALLFRGVASHMTPAEQSRQQ